MRFGEDMGRVNDIKMADIRPHDGVQLDVEGIGLGAKGPRIDRIVGFTAEVEVRHEQITNIRKVRDVAAGEIVHCFDAAEEMAERFKLVDVNGE